MRLLSKQQIQKDLTPCAPFPDVCNDAAGSKTNIIGIITDSIYSLFPGDEYSSFCMELLADNNK